MKSIFLGLSKASDIMNKDVQVIEEEANVFDAAKKMGFYKISCVLVVRGETPVGIITERDIISRVLSDEKNFNPKKIKVKEIMTAPLLSRRPDTKLKDILDLMAKYKVRRCPILDQNQIKGILTETDIVKFSQQYFKFTRSIMFALSIVIIMFLTVLITIR